MARDRILAVIQAGGAGSRMEVLTQERAKPALPLAGVYRLVDIPLTNLHHSGISDVWLAVQYQAGSMEGQVANGRPWDLDRTHGGLRLLPPQEGVGADEDGFASGNVDALFRHRDLIREARPDLVLVLSADHVYRLDYTDVIACHRAAHREHGAGCTMVTTRVGLEEAKHHTVVETRPDGRVIGVEEKPTHPAGDLVAAEMFVFDTGVLLQTLDDLHRRLTGGAAVDDTGLGDFGDELLPALIGSGQVHEYRLEGYWRDVGRPETYFAAHMDLLRPTPPLRLDDPDWPLLTATDARLPGRIAAGAEVADSLVAGGCEVAGIVRRSVLAPGVRIEAGAVVSDSIVGHDVVVERGAEVSYAILDRGVHVGADARVGGPPDGATPSTAELTLVGLQATITPGARLPRGSRLDPGGTADT